MSRAEKCNGGPDRVLYLAPVARSVIAPGRSELKLIENSDPIDLEFVSGKILVLHYMIHRMQLLIINKNYRKDDLNYPRVLYH